MPRRVYLAAITTLIAAVGRAQPAPFDPEFQVNTYTSGDQVASSVAIDPAGEFVVVWTSFGQDGSGTGVFGQRFDNTGVPQGGEFQVNTTSGGSQFYPTVGMDVSGNFVVVWDSLGQDGSRDGVVGRRFDFSGAPISTEFLVNTYTTGIQFAPGVGVQSAGDFVVVWKGNGQVYGRRYDANGKPLGSQFQVNVTPAALMSAPKRIAAPAMSGDEGPTVGVDAAGNFIVAWTDSDGSGTGIAARRYDSSGSPQGGEFRVNSFTTSRQNRPFVGVGPSGSSVIAWTSFLQDGSLDGVFAQRFDSAGVPQGGEFQVNTDTPGYQLYPSVGVDASDHVVVVWQSLSSDGGTLGVRGRRFDSAGVPDGPEFQVNSSTSYQTYPMVAMNGAGDFVVAWSASGGDGSGYGILGTRFVAGTATPLPSPTSTGTITATNTPSNTPTLTPTSTPTDTETPTATFTPSLTFTASETPTRTPTNTRTASRTPTFTSTGTITATYTSTPSNTRTASNTPTFTSTGTITATNTSTPSNTRTPSSTRTASNTPTFTSTGTITATYTSTPSNTRTPSSTRTPTRTATPSVTPGPFEPPVTFAPGPDDPRRGTR